MFCVKRFFFLGAIFLLGKLNAQKTIASVKIGNQELRKVQSFYTGDTLFVTYVEKKDLAKDVRKLFYVTQGGVSKNFYLNDFPKTAFCGFESSYGKLYHYYSEKKKTGELVFKALINDSLTVPLVSKDEIVISETLIGLSNINGLQIYTRDEAKNSIKVYKIKRLGKVSETEFLLPQKFSFVNNKDFRVIYPTTGWIEEANTKVKIFPSEDQIILTLDHQSATEILFLNLLNGSIKSTTIPEPTDPTCNSFICDGTFYRLSVFEKEVSIKTYSIPDGIHLAKYTYNLELAKSDDAKSKLDGKSKFSSNFEKLKTLLRASKLKGMPIVIVNKTSREVFYVTVASQPKEQGLKLYGYGSNPTGLILASILGNVESYLASTIDEKVEELPTVWQYLTGRLSAKGIDFSDANNLHSRIAEILKSKRELKYLDLTVRNMNNAYLVVQDLKKNTIEVLQVSY